jgi:hypothetical protein
LLILFIGLPAGMAQASAKRHASRSAFEQAVALDPLSPLWPSRSPAKGYCHCGRDEAEALAEADKIPFLD